MIFAGFQSGRFVVIVKHDRIPLIMPRIFKKARKLDSIVVL
jgi:hypothetical protein